MDGVRQVGLLLSFDTGEQASRRVANDTLRCSGTKTLSSTEVLEPLAVNPAQYQVSSCFTCATGTTNSRMSGRSSPSRKTSPPIMIHCEWRSPLHHDQRPSSR